MGAAAHEEMELVLHAERTVLGAVLLRNDLLWCGTLSALQVCHFLLKDHRQIYRTMLELAEEGVPFDVSILAAAMIEGGRELKAADNRAYLQDLTDGVAVENRHVQYLSKRITRAWRLREQRRLGERIEKEVSRAGADPQQIARLIETSLAQMDLGACERNNAGIAQPSKVAVPALPDVRRIASENTEFLVPGLLVKGTVTVLSGEASAGKTTLALYWSDAIAQGREILGGRCEQHPVLYLTRENPVDYVADIARRLNIKNGPGTKLYIWGDWVEERAPAPAASCVLAWVSASQPAPFVVLDSLIAFFDGKNENDAAEMRAFLNQARRLLRAGAAGVLIIHHPGKSESSREYRGSSDLKPAIDAGYVLTNSGDGVLERLFLKAFKTRFLAQKRELMLTYRDGTFVSEERPAVIRESVTQQLTRLLEANPGITKKEFVEAAMAKKLTQHRARSFLDDGIACGSIRYEEGAHNKHFYYLVQGTDLVQ